MARALRVAHAAGLVHRDLKPANIPASPSTPPRELLAATVGIALAGFLAL